MIAPERLDREIPIDRDRVPEERVLEGEIRFVSRADHEPGNDGLGDGLGLGVIEGSAAIFDKWSPWYGWDGDFRERIDRAAFADVMGSDVRVLFNHEPSELLGRTSAHTARLIDTREALRFTAELPDTDIGRRVATNLQRGDITGSSFSFTVAEDTVDFDKEAGTISRTIVKIDELFDVGPVTFPFYPSTRVVLEKMKDLARDIGVECCTHAEYTWWWHHTNLL